MQDRHRYFGAVLCPGDDARRHVGGGVVARRDLLALAQGALPAFHVVVVDFGRRRHRRIGKARDRRVEFVATDRVQRIRCLVECDLVFLASPQIADHDRGERVGTLQPHQMVGVELDVQHIDAGPMRDELAPVRPVWRGKRRRGDEHKIAFDEAAYSLDSIGGYEFDTVTTRFAYSSMTTPTEVYDYDMESRQRALRKRQQIPSGHDPAAYVTTRITARTEDGAEVPVSILHRRDLVRDGSAPLLLYGYGSYGMSMPASFAANRLSLVDRGFVYAIAHIRGGSDKGWNWYLDGKREKKTNTFDDFAAAGRALIDAKYTEAKRIVGHGGSAGGMLMGAVANRAPELFAAIVAEVPFVDVLNTMMDDTLPLTPPEWPEWGNPITDEAAFRTILAYSPYDNVAAKSYPAILAMGGLTDPRVTYWEPAKWVARLRATMTGGGPVLLRTNMGAGHGGSSGRFNRLDEVAIAYAFALWAVGLA